MFKMIHNFVYDSYSAYKRIQSFEYLDNSLAKEYSFEYSRNILSDLSKFNAPIFAQRERRGIIFNDKTWFYQRDRRGIVLDDYVLTLQKENHGFPFERNAITVKKDEKKNIVFDNTNKNITQISANRIVIDELFNGIFVDSISTFDMFKILFGTKYCHTKMFQGFVAVDEPIKKSYIADMYAGYKFIYPNSNNLLVLYNDSILSMTEAFNQQVINEARIKSLFPLYKTQYENLYNDNVKSLDYNLLLEIKNEYALKNNIKELDNIIILNYFGTYNDAVVLMISEGGYFPSITTETVDGIEFRYPNSIKISVYKNKLFYDLIKAFEDNLVTHNELVEINKLFNE
jgi:hypothetical protein